MFHAAAIQTCFGFAGCARRARLLYTPSHESAMPLVYAPLSFPPSATRDVEMMIFDCLQRASRTALPRQPAQLAMPHIEQMRVSAGDRLFALRFTIDICQRVCHTAKQT